MMRPILHVLLERSPLLKRRCVRNVRSFYILAKSRVSLLLRTFSLLTCVHVFYSRLQKENKISKFSPELQGLQPRAAQSTSTTLSLAYNWNCNQFASIIPVWQPKQEL